MANDYSGDRGDRSERRLEEVPLWMIRPSKREADQREVEAEGEGIAQGVGARSSNREGEQLSREGKPLPRDAHRLQEALQAVEVRLERLAAEIDAHTGRLAMERRRLEERRSGDAPDSETGIGHLPRPSFIRPIGVGFGALLLVLFSLWAAPRHWSAPLRLTGEERTLIFVGRALFETLSDEEKEVIRALAKTEQSNPAGDPRA